MKTDSRYYNYCAGENRMVDTLAIKQAIVNSDFDQRSLADEIGVSYHTIRNRLKYGNWTVLEAYRMCDVLGLDFMSVFFAKPQEAWA